MDILKNPHITALAQIIHIEMVHILHPVSPLLADAQIFRDHDSYVKILLIKTFWQRTHYICQSPGFNKWYCFRSRK